MKFALAFTALASAANNQAPVISLNLADCTYTGCMHPQGSGRTAAHGLEAKTQADGKSDNSFADECAVSQNHLPSDPGCQEPEASAYDHHDGAIDVTTSYTLFVSSGPKENPTPKHSTPSSIDLSVRGEWIIKYDASDKDGNEAETLTFALILNDEVAPACSGNIPGCHTGADGYRTYLENGNLEIELCDATDLAAGMTWSPVSQTNTNDLYDGSLDASNSIFSSGLKQQGSGAAISGSTSQVPSNLYKGITSALTLNYEITSEDFAGIFGTQNKNNVFTKTGEVVLQDTTSPVITSPAWPAAFECGFSPAAVDYTTDYTDCYDDWGATTKSTVSVKVNDAAITSSFSVFGDAGFYVNGATKPADVTLVYDVSDTHGNPAQTVSKTIALSDTLAPTLYITKSDGHTNGESTAEGDVCAHGGMTTGATDGDSTYTDHCTAFTTKDGHTTYTHSSDETNVDTSATMEDETQIQHSAGYAADYNFIVELMQEGTGYRCEDACASTTTTVEWHSSCSSGASGAHFDMRTPGTYYLKYSCTDGTHSTTACRTFINVDKTRPIISVIDAANQNDGTYVVEASRDNNYVDAGATCSDMIDGNISEDVEVSGDVVNMAAVGTYKITYNCQDSAEQTAIAAVRTVVVKDTTCPTCTLTGDATKSVEASFPYEDEGSSCTDTLDGELTPYVVGLDAVNVEETGVYVITYTATDAAQNDAAQCDQTAPTRTVTVEDNLKPVISLQYRGQQLMAESTSSVNGWVIGAVASAVSGVALLGYAATRKATVATSVPV